MKKLLLLFSLFISVFFITGCRSKESLRIIVPSGSPTLAQLYLQENSDDYSVDVVNGADPLVAAFTALTPTHDVIFAPTNLGAKLYQSGSKYLFAGTVVWGNYYLVTTAKTSFEMSSLSNQDIVVFGQNQTSDIIMKFLSQSLDIEMNFTYVDSVASAAAIFMADKTKIVMVAEPTLSNIKSKVTDLQIIDLQTVYQSVTNESSYPQAGVFVLNSLTKRQINQFLDDLKNSIDTANEKPIETGELAETLEIGFTKEIVASAIPFSHLEFQSASDSKTALETYFNQILSINPALIGNSLPDDDFYYHP